MIALFRRIILWFMHRPVPMPNAGHPWPHQMSAHIDGPRCLGCEAKLAQVHPDLAKWFNEKIKPAFSRVHISWGYRDQVNQEQCVAEGKSELHFPNSAHNKSDPNGNPQSTALDLFEQWQGVGSWPVDLFHQVWLKSQDDILWGGVWRSLGDNDHFQLKHVTLEIQKNENTIPAA